MRKFFNQMNTEETKESANQSATETPDNRPEEALTDAHNPDIGIPEEPVKEEPAANPEEKWQHEAAEWKDKYLRIYAEFDNFRKRAARERSELLSTASADLIKELLPIIDDFDRAIRANETVEDISVVKEGFILIHQKLYKRLESKGLKPVNAIGQPFDTDFHEAITQVPAPSEDLKGKVVDEVEKGYTMNDKVVRFSKVIIGS
jgi:molecular chaperone GrpE